jgi:hypothetical protein
MVSLGFSVTYFFRPYHGPGVDSGPSENEYQEHFLGVKAAGAKCYEMWEHKPPGTLWATPGMLLNSFIFYNTKITIYKKFFFVLYKCETLLN